jgi:RNA polymerase sigma factor FliA
VAEDMQTLWVEFRKSRDKKLRDRLILNYAPLVKYVAGRLGSGLPAHVDEGDLVSYGLLGLIGAIERFNPDLGIKFETYAIARIKGSIIDELRSMDWVPRSVRARARDIERAIAALEAKHARAPTDEEIAAKLGITEEEFQDSLLEISRSSIAALDELWSSPGSGGDTVALIDTIEDPLAAEPQQAMAHTELREALGEAISRLPEREKLVVTLYYYEELTLREIGEVLGVTESRVSQLHTKAILRLKARLSASRDRDERDTKRGTAEAAERERDKSVRQGRDR